MTGRKSIEKEYIRAYKAYKKGTLSAVEFRQLTQKMHFTNPSGTLMRLGENAVWYASINNGWQFDSYFIKEKNHVVHF